MTKKTEQDIIAEEVSFFLLESEEERLAFIKKLQLAPGEHDLSDKELKDFAKRSHGIASSPAQISAINDIDAMGKTRLQQVIDHPKVHVFMKHRARKRLSGEWK